MHEIHCFVPFSYFTASVHLINSSIAGTQSTFPLWSVILILYKHLRQEYNGSFKIWRLSAQAHAGDKSASVGVKHFLSSTIWINSLLHMLHKYLPEAGSIWLSKQPWILSGS